MVLIAVADEDVAVVANGTQIALIMLLDVLALPIDSLDQ
ncbi:hypothetical protein A2U01_0115919, partial [Trifolium medium]|nr:hypothetical protein [Trifolium medium]